MEMEFLDLRARLKAYFAPARWSSYQSQFAYSGPRLAQDVMQLMPRFVVDAGCGYNEFKGRIPNLIGIDLVNPHADLVCDLPEAPISEGSIDVVLALGSINFGSEANVLCELRAVSAWMTPGATLFMRGNPGYPLDDESIVIFPWSRHNIPTIGAQVGLVVDSDIVDDDFNHPRLGRSTRLFWTYKKAASQGFRTSTVDRCDVGGESARIGATAE